MRHLRWFIAPKSISPLVTQCPTQRGHDLVIGGQLRTDKPVVAPGWGTSSVTFASSRQRLLRGGGNV